MTSELHATAFTYAELPDGPCIRAATYQHAECLYGYLSKPLIDDLAVFLRGRHVVEAYAGRGHLSALLQAQGVAIHPTSLRSGHDGSSALGHVAEVAELSVAAAIRTHRDWMDTLLVNWPTTSEELYRALPLLPEGALIIFIGEVTDYDCKPFPFLGGCATDSFFAAVEELPELSAQIRYPTLRQDQLKVYRRKRP